MLEKRKAIRPKISVGRHSGAISMNIDSYRPLVGDELIDELLALARELNGVRICHVNSTALGGGVAELLSRYLPLLQTLGLSADWRIIHGTGEFFAVTKSFHNALQGAQYHLTEADRRIYFQVNEESAKLFGQDYDVYIVHDPQPAAIRHFTGAAEAKWI